MLRFTKNRNNRELYEYLLKHLFIYFQQSETVNWSSVTNYMKYCTLILVQISRITYTARNKFKHIFRLKRIIK